MHRKRILEGQQEKGGAQSRHSSGSCSLLHAPAAVVYPAYLGPSCRCLVAVLNMATSRGPLEALLNISLRAFLSESSSYGTMISCCFMTLFCIQFANPLAGAPPCISVIPYITIAIFCSTINPCIDYHSAPKESPESSLADRRPITCCEHVLVERLRQLDSQI